MLLYRTTGRAGRVGDPHDYCFLGWADMRILVVGAGDRMAFADQLPATMTSSMHHDLERGHRLELAWLSGDVLARGERLGVPTPCSRVIVAILSIYGNGSAG